MIQVPTYLIVAIAIVLIFIGTLLIFIDMLRRTEGRDSSRHEGRVDVGGAVIVGPIPIVFGSSREVTKVMLILAIALTALAITLTLINYYLR